MDTSLNQFLDLPSKVPLAQWLLANFPSNVHLFANSLTARIMERLSTFFLMQSTRETQIRELSPESAKFVKTAPNILHALLALSFLEESESPTEPSAFPTFRASQRKLKQMKKLSAKNSPHEGILVQAGMVVPCCRAEADEQVTTIYEKLRNIFEVSCSINVSTTALTCSTAILDKNPHTSNIC